jgi:hypothetical protein
MKFKIVNMDQGHKYVHHVEAPDSQTAIERFKSGHYGQILECTEIKNEMKHPTITAALLDENSQTISEFVEASIDTFMFDKIVYLVEWRIRDFLFVKGILFTCEFKGEISFHHITGNRNLEPGDYFIFRWTRNITSMEQEEF